MTPEIYPKISSGIPSRKLALSIAISTSLSFSLAYSSESATSDNLAMETITVIGSQQEDALASQREAMNITTQTSTSAYGNMPDGNLGEVIKRLPGVAPTYEFGEVTNFSIRGIDPSRNSVTVDGARMPSSGSQPGGRGTRIDQLPGDFIKTIELVKAPTPDMDADAIGGSANLVTKSGLDFEERTFGFTLGTNYRVEREFLEPTGTLSFADKFGANDQWGILAIASHSVSKTPADIVQQRSRRGSGNEDFLVTEGVERITSFRIHDDIMERSRSNVSVRVDYQANSDLKLYMNTFFNHYDEEKIMRRSESYGFTVPQAYDNLFPFPGNFQGHWLYNPEFDDNISIQEYVVVQHRISAETTDSTSSTLHFQPGLETSIANWDIDAQASYATTRNERDQLHTYGQMRNDRANGSFFGETAWRIEGANDTFPSFTQIGGPDAYELDNYTLDRHVNSERIGNDELYGTSLNMRRDLQLAYPTAVQLGVRYRGQRAEWDQSGILLRQRGSFPAGSAYRGQTSDFLDRNYSHEPAGGRYRQFPWPDPRLAEQSRLQNPELWIEDPRQSSAADARGLNQTDINLAENIFAGYMMSEVEIGRLSVLGGVRFEHTEVEGRGVLDDPEAETIEEQFAQRISSSRSYSTFLPGLHLRYEPLNDLLIRGSFTRTIARPSFNSILPQTRIISFAQDGLQQTDIPGRVTQNNVGLKPQVSDNLDLSIEYYFDERALLSVGAFQKDINNFITSSSGLLGPDNDFGSEFDGYEFQTNINANSARVQGIEFSYQQQFSFLPGPLSNLGGFANATYLTTKGDYQDGAESGNVPGFTPRSANVGLSYEGNRFTARINTNYKSETLTNWDENRFIKRRYDKAFMMTDISLEARITPSFTAFFDVRNVFDEKLINRKAPRIRPYQVEAYGTRINVGVRGTF